MSTSKQVLLRNKNQLRKQRGKIDDTAMFPVTSSKFEMPEDYAPLLANLKKQISQTRFRVILSSNTVMVILYWDIGKQILDKQEKHGWGAKIIDRLSFDLRESFPDMKGFSPRNLKYMRAFANAWSRRKIVQEVLAQLPWYHNIALLEKLKSEKERLWYAVKAYQYGWSHNVLSMQIDSQAHLRFGKAQNNFSHTLPAVDSDMAVQAFKDPYLFDFLGTDLPRRETELEQGLVNHVRKFLLELGQGFAFVGQQVHLELGNNDYYIDLLFYHLQLRRYVVLEIKARQFESGDGAQLGMYITAVNQLLNHSDDKPAIGLLLVKEKNKILVEYALKGTTHPITVSEWETKLTRSLPENLQDSLPTIEALEAELSSNPTKIRNQYS